MGEIRKYVITEEVESWRPESPFMNTLATKFRDRIQEKVDSAIERSKEAIVDAIFPTYNDNFKTEFAKCFQEALDADYYNNAVSIINKKETTVLRELDEKIQELKGISFAFDKLVKCLDGVQISANVATTNYLNKRIDNIKALLEGYKDDEDES